MGSDELPFNEGTKLYQTFMILSDQQWHCGKHELPGTQPAKAIQVIGQHGYTIEKRTMYCDVCQDRTVHRRLVSIQPSRDSFVRVSMPTKLRRRVLAYYSNTEAITMQQLKTHKLEVDHRFPQIRWSKDERLDINMSDDELHRRFQLLTRQNNLWKSRKCEHCKQTGERGTFIGILYFASGGPIWNPNIPEDDERGCFGCFWYDPDEWRRSLNELLNAKQGS